MLRSKYRLGLTLLDAAGPSWVQTPWRRKSSAGGSLEKSGNCISARGRYRLRRPVLAPLQAV